MYNFPRSSIVRLNDFEDVRLGTAVLGFEVPLDMCSRGEGSPALPALVGLLPRVGEEVSLQCVPSNEPHAALLTRVPLLSSVDHLMRSVNN